MQQLLKILRVLDFLSSEDIETILHNTHQYNIDHSTNKLIISLVLHTGFKLSLLQKIWHFNNTNNNFELAVTIRLDQLDKSLINMYINEFLKTHKKQNLIKIWELTDFAIVDNSLQIKYHSELHMQEWKNIEQNLLDYLTNKLYITSNPLILLFDNDLLEYEKKIIKNEESSLKEYEKNIVTIVKEKNKRNYMYSSNFSDPIVPIGELNFNDKNKLIVGEIFSVKSIKLRNNSSIIYYYLTDHEHSICVKQYLNSDEPIPAKIGDQVKMIIDVEVSTNNSREYMGGKLKKIKVEEKILSNPEQYLVEHRTEWSVHTKMSAYDGLIELNELKNRLEFLGHTNFAVTDRYNVQNYPEIYKIFKNSSVKPIYGVELEIIPEKICAILNPVNQSIYSTEYVVFDLETTGLYPEFDDIIEFGAVTIKDGVIQNSENFFIKPNVPLKKKIQEITNITNQDLQNAVSQEEGLKKILDYLQNKTLVAHNGINFDFNFINKKLEQYNLPKLTNCLIDTMVISRSINPTYKSNTLEFIAKKEKIAYDPSAAHRANYDADLLAKVWLAFIKRLAEADCTNIQAINDFIQNESLNKATRGEFIVAYAKNQKGIRDIYELVSLAHTTHFYNRPTITWKEINKFRDNLLMTNLCIESDVLNSALTKSTQELVHVIKQYDFITVCGPSGFYHEIKADNISEQQYKKIVSKIIDVAYQQNKKVIAVSNAYYLYEHEKKFHDLYVTMPILNKKAHRFFKYKNGPIMFLKDTTEMNDEFAFLNDQNLIDEINFKNSLFFLEQIDKNIKPMADKLYPPKIEGVDQKIITKVYETAHKIYGEELPSIIKQRLDKELDSITSHGYSVVYWISHLLVNESIKDGYVVGSRGSVGSSLVATFLNITDVNPLPPHYLCKHCKYSNFDIDPNIEDGFDLPPMTCPQCNKTMDGEGHNIWFEVFLGFYGDKVPDIDLNFSGNYQAQAHNFIKKMFDDTHAFRAGTISTIAEKTSFNNTRAYFDEIKKDPNPAEIELYSMKCVDVKRTTGQHPGGIIVVPNDMSIYDFTPYNYPADDKTQDWYTTHFAFEYIHDNLLKFDILGHDNPTILKMLKDYTGVDEKDVPHYDEKTLHLFSNIAILNIDSEQVLDEPTGAISLPEFGTRFVREMLTDAKPQSFADLIRISGLSHGTDVWLGNAKSLIKNDGLTLKQIIACRDDIMSYLISHEIEPKIAFSIMEDVRKGKGIKEEHVAILKKHKVPNWYIDSCNKIKYIFPKAHATAYVMHAWKFAWYKINYPLEYYASYFSIKSFVFNLEVLCKGLDAIKAHYVDINNRIKKQLAVTTKEKDLLGLYEVAIEMYARGFKFVMVDINLSKPSEFIIDKENKSLICPLQTIDGMGETVAQSIIDARNERKFSSREDFINRTKISKQHIQQMEKLNIISDLDENEQMVLFKL